MSADIPNNAMRAVGEADRSSEFMAARQTLVDGINKWVNGLAESRDLGRPLKDGLALSTSPRIIRTDLGGTLGNFRSMAEEIKPGVVILGDKTGALVLQAVFADMTPGEIDIIEAQGSDPMSQAVYGDSYAAGRSTEVVASFGWVTKSGTSEQSYSYSVLGNGSVKYSNTDSEGVNVGRTLQNLDDLMMAQVALEQIAEAIQ